MDGLNIERLGLAHQKEALGSDIEYAEGLEFVDYLTDPSAFAGTLFHRVVREGALVFNPGGDAVESREDSLGD